MLSCAHGRQTTDHTVAADCEQPVSPHDDAGAVYRLAVRGRIPSRGAFVDGSSGLVGKPRAIGKRAPEIVAECQLVAENIAELTERKRERVGEDVGVVADLDPLRGGKGA